jgi:alpha-galactosidase/6-phospho-beta-glucosidase family protein
LPLEAIVETDGLLDETGPKPYTTPMPREIAALTYPHVERQELTVEAALEGDFHKALHVMQTDPLVAGNVEIARPLLEEMMAASRPWLPQFS